MSILLSVNPPFAGWLVDGEKTIEWRKKPLPVGTAYIYETKKNGGCGMVIGEVYFGTTNGVPKELLGNRREALTYLWGKDYSDRVIAESIATTNDFISLGKVSKKDLAEYAKGHKAIYANDCWDYKRYDKPIPLSEFRIRKTIRGYHKQGETFAERLLHGGRVEVKQITRPPQSWCYVDDSVLGNPGWSVPKAELHECKDCARYDECKDHVIPNETFWEVGGCKAFEKKGETK